MSRTIIYKKFRDRYKGLTIFNTLENFCDEKEIPLKNIMSIYTDGAPAMTGRHKSFIAYLKNKVVLYTTQFKLVIISKIFQGIIILYPLIWSMTSNLRDIKIVVNHDLDLY